ncbi:NUDIX domain-containing protein [Pigmentiphaga soli]|uniref:NUDIX domain-containing protein n=1 Tax=Pigmentiphaga soli TaxID=1007095 RepID=A0ABP8H0Y1_9BURK
MNSILARAQVDPPADARRLSIAGRACGWVAGDVVPLLLPFAEEIAVAPDAVHMLPGTGQPARAAVDGLLARVAQALFQAGRLNGWRNELLDVEADDGTVLGVIERAAVRPLGIATHAVHLNAWTPDGRAWIARRAATKTTDPGKWDTLVGGLISAAETPEIALARESWEEAGLMPEHLAGGQRRGRFRVRRTLPEGYQIENVTVVDVVLGPGVTPANQDGEVDLIRTVRCDEALAMIGRDEFTLEAALSLLLGCAARHVPLGVDPEALSAVAA